MIIIKHCVHAMVELDNYPKKSMLQCLAILDLKEDKDTLEVWKKSYPTQKIFFEYIDVAKRSVVEESIGKAKDEMGGLDAFVNCSGILQESVPELCIQVNLVSNCNFYCNLHMHGSINDRLLLHIFFFKFQLGTIYTSLTAVNLMGKHKGGNGGIVVNVASVLGLKPCHPFAVYSASKHGCIGFTRSLSVSQRFL